MTGSRDGATLRDLQPGRNEGEGVMGFDGKQAKVGDEVVIHPWNGEIRLATIARILPSGRMEAGGRMWTARGESYPRPHFHTDSAHIRAVADGDREAIRRRELWLEIRRRLDRTMTSGGDPSTLKTETLETIARALGLVATAGGSDAE